MGNDFEGERMRNTFLKNMKKTAAGIMAIMMLLVMLSSAYFLAAHADHDCDGEDCPVCACIHQCENLIRGVGDCAAAVSAVLLPVFLTFLFLSCGIGPMIGDTPVSMKVRMNN